MQKSRVLNLSYFNNFFSFVSLNRVKIFVSVSFLVGLALGVLRFNKNGTEYFSVYLTDFIALRQNSSFLKIFIHSFLDSLTFMFVLYALGASMFGVVTAPLLLGFKGYSFGAIAALLYNNYALKGVAFNSVIILPSAIFLIIALLLSAEDSVKFSFVLARLTISEYNTSSMPMAFKKYSIRYLTFVLLLLVSAAVDALVSHNFLKSFL